MSKILFRVREEKDINSFSEYFPDKINSLEGSEIEDDDVIVQPKNNGDNSCTDIKEKYYTFI